MIFNLSSFIPLISFVLYILFAVFGIYQKKVGKIHWPFIFYMFLMAMWSFGSFMMHANTGILSPLFWNRFMVVGMLGGPIVIFHSLLDLFEERRSSYNLVLYMGYVIYGFLLYLNFRGHIVAEAYFIGNEFYYSLAKGSSIAYVLSYLFLLFGIFVLLRELYLAKNEALKKKFRLPIIGAAIMLGGVLVNLYEPLGRYPIDLFASTINAFIIFYAIYKYRLVNYSAFVIRSILYLVLVIISAFIFYGIIWASFRIMRKIPFQYSFLLSIFLGIVAAIIFQPLRTGTLSVIEKLYFGKRLDYYRSLKSFSESLSTIVELDKLGASTVNKVVETFNLEWAMMLVLDYATRNYKIIAKMGEKTIDLDEEEFVVGRNTQLIKELQRCSEPIFYPSKAEYEEDLQPLFSNGLSPEIILPLKFKEKLNGFICLGRCRDKEYFDQFDAEILGILTGQCSLALENAISFEKLRRQQKRLQEMNKELIISRNKLEAFFDGITTPISIQDINYNIIMVNYAATRYFRKPFNNLVGSKCYNVFFGRNKPCENCMAQDCLHSQLPFTMEKVDENTGMTFSIHFYPISVPHGSEKIFLEFFQDITQQKRLQEELIQSEKMAGIGTLASGIAHEINNPLCGIIGTAEILLEEVDKDEKLKEYTLDIIKYAQGAAEIIKDLARYSRREEKATTLVDVNMVVEDTLKLARRGMKFKEIEVEKRYGDVPKLEANMGELQQVLLNLIINAVQAMQGKGTLILETREEAGNVVMVVSDTGPGIEKKDIENIFNPFYTTKEPGKGTGLGLSIVYQIIYNMGGRINVDSRPGAGTSFAIQIPINRLEKSRIRFIHAKSTKEIEDVFYLQRKILVGEKGYLEETIRRPEDEKAYHVLAYKGLQPVGTVSCLSDRVIGRLPVEDHFPISDLKKGFRCVEIDRLAVMKEERRSIIPLGLMSIAYLYAKSQGAERIFLDVFSDEKKYINMYKKLGFKKIGEYEWLLPVTVMMMDQKTDYEKKARELERFVKPFLARLVKRLDFSEDEKTTILKAVESIIKSSPKDEISNDEISNDEISKSQDPIKEKD